MEGDRQPLPPVPRSRFRHFKNPPQPHMCIADTLRDSSEKLYINVLGWQKIPNPKQYSDPIPLYGGMKVPQTCAPNGKPPATVFAVMVNPEILKVNGKNAANPGERDALVSLLCDFVEAMNPGLRLARRPAVLRGRDLAGELKDVWLAVQAKRDRERGASNHCVYKVYDIDGVAEDPDEAPCGPESPRPPPPRAALPSACQPLRDPRDLLHDIDYYQASQCGMIGRQREVNHTHAHKQSALKAGAEEARGRKPDFYPVFAGAAALVAPLQGLDLHSTDTRCDNNSDFSSVSS